MDLKLSDVGDGGELEYFGQDLTIIDGLSNLVYLALFGGNPGFISPFERQQYEQLFDYWGNTFLLEDQKFNSYTEYTLNNNALSSSGRSEIEKAVKKDLAFMSEFANLTIDVSIVSDKRISITVQIDEPDNIENTEFRFIWDSSKQELINDDDTNT